MSTPAHRWVVERIGRLGPRPFDEVMDAALYLPEGGFYATGGLAGRRRGDFVTSPETGPLFGACLAEALDAWWGELGRPTPFVVVEAGAGRGALARAVLDAEPECLTALRYLLVERSPALRARQREHLDLEDPALALERGRGPVVVSLAGLPRESFTGVVLANELLDNLPVRLLERRGGAWSEVLVGAESRPGDERGVDLADGERQLVEVVVPAPPRLAALAESVAPGAPDGGRLPVQAAAARWLRSALDVCARGRVVIIDYAADSPAIVRRPPDAVVRTYRAHERGTDPLSAVGAQDLTCDVAVDQLAAVVGPPDLDRTQAAFLDAHGVGALVDEGRRIWRERAHLGDLQAVRARSRVSEAEALTDPAGLGGFRVLEWRR